MCILKLFAGLRAVSGIGLVSSLTLLSVTLVSVFLFSCDDPTGSGPEVIAVHGTVSSLLSGQPLSGATVTLLQHGAPIQSAQTTGDGAYTFTGIEASAGYTVTASASIHLESATAVFTVTGNHDKSIMLDRDWPSVGTVVATAVSNMGGSIAVAPDGTIYMTDTNQNKIRKIAPGGTTPEAYAGTGGVGVADGSLASATFNQPAGIAVSADGTEVYVADSWGNRVRQITSSQVVTIAGSGSSGAFSGDNGYAKQAQLKSPRGVAVDTAGNIYVTDNGNGRVRKISADGKISTIAGGGGQTQAEGEALSAQLSAPQGIAVDIEGNVYMTEYHRVRKITPGSIISTVFGTTSYAANLSGLDNPKGIAVDAAGTVYVADYKNHRILKVLADGTAFLLAGGSQGNALGELDAPWDLAIGPDGSLYIYDRDNSRIMKY